MDRPRTQVMIHMMNKNIGLLIPRQTSGAFHHVFVTTKICDINLTGSAGKFGGGLLFPLYLYPDESQEGMFGAARKPNLKMELVAEIAKKLKMTFVEDGTGDGKKAFGPEDILDYIYAFLHSPAYREKYKEFLKIDFPRVPFTSDVKLFWKLVTLGKDIRLLHLMESPKLEKLITRYPVDGSNVVEKIEFEGKEEGKVKINEAQHFDGVPRSAWEFFIGGYQPAQKWLKDRKGRTLTVDDIMHYQRMIVALTETDGFMKEIDEMIKKNGGFPLK